MTRRQGANMKHKRTSDVPVLLLERDGYEIETVLVGPNAKYTAWLLLCRRPSGRVSPAGTGWTEGHENARREAYALYREHSAAAARDGDAQTPEALERLKTAGLMSEQEAARIALEASARFRLTGPRGAL